jgi:hypothetical protein
VPRSLAALALAAVCGFYAAAAQAQAASEPEASAARAAEPTRVVLVASPGMEELVVRFMAELGSLQLEVIRAPDAEAAPAMSELELLAQSHAARVAVRVRKAGRAIDLWLVNSQSHELVYRRVLADGDAAVLVLRSLEILRGALVDLHAIEEVPAPPKPPAVTRPPKPEGPEPKPRSPSFWLGLSGALVAAHAGRTVGGGAVLSLHRRQGSRFALHGEVLVPLDEWSVEGDGGSAKIRLGTATLAGIVNPWGEQTLTPGLGLGLGVVVLHSRGEADAGFQGTSELNAAFFPHSRVDLALNVNGWLRLRAAVTGGFASPRPVLLFGQKREESWVNPLLLASLGAELALP